MGAQVHGPFSSDLPRHWLGAALKGKQQGHKLLLTCNATSQLYPSHKVSPYSNIEKKKRICLIFVGEADLHRRHIERDLSACSLPQIAAMAGAECFPEPGARNQGPLLFSPKTINNNRGNDGYIRSGKEPHRSGNRIKSAQCL